MARRQYFQYDDQTVRYLIEPLCEFSVPLLLDPRIQQHGLIDLNALSGGLGNIPNAMNDARNEAALQQQNIAAMQQILDANATQQRRKRGLQAAVRRLGRLEGRRQLSSSRA